MGYIKERMTQVFDTRALLPIDTDTDTETMPYVIMIDATATGASSFTYTLKDKVRVIDAWAIPAATQTSATAQVKDADGNAITDAMDIATNKTIARASTIDDDNWEESAGNDLEVEQNANADSAYVFVVVIPIK